MCRGVLVCWFAALRLCRSPQVFVAIGVIIDLRGGFVGGGWRWYRAVKLGAKNSGVEGGRTVVGVSYVWIVVGGVVRGL